jgi:hypothetical protein
MATTSLEEVPIDRDGMPVTGTTVTSDHDYTYVPNDEFTATFELDHMLDSNKVILRQVSNPRAAHSMFMKDLIDMCKHANIEQGVVSGTWAFRRMSHVYGLCWLHD